MKFNTTLVRVYVSVSNENTIPINQVLSPDSRSRNCSIGSLKVKHIREVDMQKALARTGNLHNTAKKPVFWLYLYLEI